MTPPMSEVLLTKYGEPSEVASGMRTTSVMPPTLLRQAVRRLRVLSLVFGGIFLFGWFFKTALEGHLVQEFQDPGQWGPPVVAILSSAVVFALTRSKRIPPEVVVRVGLVYQVVVAYALALATMWRAFEGIHPEFFTHDRVGSSDVVFWMLLYTVLVPSRPRSAAIALLCSASATPVVYAFMVALGDAPMLEPGQFFFVFVFHYLLTALGAYLAASIIYRMGKDLRRAQEMGSYRLEAVLGSGGMGEVWRARHSMLARPAAVKLIRRDAIGSDAVTVDNVVERFEREAQATAELQSPHTVDLYDFGTSSDGTLYYVMELLDGVDLGTLVERFGPLEPERVVRVLRQVCESLDEAHGRGLVHRDIKPANIYLCRYALRYDFVKVLDFGLVKRHEKLEGDSELSLTRAGAITGTPSFVAPEIALDKEPVAGRADIYALGCVAYWLLTGRLVFDAATPVGMIVAHINEQPSPPSAHTELPVPEALDALVLECLAKEPEGRPASAGELARRLDSIELPTQWTDERAARWWNSHQLSGAEGRAQ
jgi:serine/threonine-protein kinase